MATSGSTDFTLTAYDLIIEARKKIGIHETEEPLQADQLTMGKNTLNVMLKAWQVGGVSMSQYTEGEITLSQGDKALQFGGSGSPAFATVPFDMVDVRITRNNTDLPMMELSREEYYAIPNKSQEGYPTQWYYDRQRNGGTLYLWPAADVTAGTLKFTYIRKIEDMDSNENDLDLPQEWYEAVIYGLADRMAEEYGLINTPLGQRVAQKAALSLQEIKEFDTGEGKGSLTILPSAHRTSIGYR